MVVARGHTIAPLAAATIELYSRLWLELEALCNLFQAEAARHGAGINVEAADIDVEAADIDVEATGVEARLEMLRLEMMLLLDGCGSARWRSLLRPDQLAALRENLQAVLRSLDTPAAAFGLAAVVNAQNRLFDAVIDQYSLGLESEARSGSTERWAGKFQPAGCGRIDLILPADVC